MKTSAHFLLRSLSAALALGMIVPLTLTADEINRKTTTSSPQNGSVSSISGEAYIIREGKTLPLTPGMEIREKDIIKTNNGGIVQIAFPDKTQTTIGSGSQVEVTTYRFTTTEAKANFTVLGGTIETKAGEIATKNPESFSIKTENSLMTAKSADVTLQAQVTSGGDKIVAQSGEVSVQPLKSSSGGVDVKAGQMTVVTENKITQTPQAMTTQENATFSQSLGKATTTPPQAEIKSFVSEPKAVVIKEEPKVHIQPSLAAPETTLPSMTKTETTPLPTLGKTETSTLPTMAKNETVTLPGTTKNETTTLPTMPKQDNQPSVVPPTVTIPVMQVVVNQAPSIKTSETELTFKALALKANSGKIDVLDPNGDKVNFTIIRAPLSGIATINAEGMYTYKAASGFYGYDSFIVEVDDTKDRGKVQTTIKVYNDRPLVEDVTLSLLQNMQTPSSGKVTGSDKNSDTLTYSVVNQPIHGQLTFNANGNYRYTPHYNYTGTDTFSYKANDGLADSDMKTVTVNVTDNVNHPNTDPTVLTFPENSLTPPSLGETVGNTYAKSAGIQGDYEWGVWSNADRPYNELLVQTHITGYWIKGTQTPHSVIENYIRNDQVATYTGTNSVLGHFSEGVTKSAITSSNVNLSVKFGATSPLSGNINFSSSNQSVALTVNGGTVVPNNISLTTSGVTNTGTGNVNVSSFSMNGKFYGPTANALGANITGLGTNGSSTVSFQGVLGGKK